MLMSGWNFPTSGEEKRNQKLSNIYFSDMNLNCTCREWGGGGGGGGDRLCTCFMPEPPS